MSLIVLAKVAVNVYVGSIAILASPRIKPQTRRLGSCRQALYCVQCQQFATGFAVSSNNFLQSHNSTTLQFVSYFI